MILFNTKLIESNYQKLVLYSRTKGVKQKYLLYISSIGSGSQVSAIYNVQIYSCSRTHNRELMLHCSTLIHLEDRYMSTMSFNTVSRWSLSVLSVSPVLVTVYHSAHPTRA